MPFVSYLCRQVMIRSKTNKKNFEKEIIMEIILALIVVSAVIFFGALISMGNERQRRAIDGVREQIVLWAMQDLRIKREKLARDVHVDDPLGWFNQIAVKISGMALSLRLVEAIENLGVLIFTSDDGSSHVVFSSTSPEEIRRMKYGKNNRLSKYTNDAHLLSLLSRATVYEISVLNGGIFFDIELPMAWKALTGKDFGNLDRIWMYVWREN